eukprot:scaffold9600_cov132-Isochrysis_galbana.AAC.7
MDVLFVGSQAHSLRLQAHSQRLPTAWGPIRPSAAPTRSRFAVMSDGASVNEEKDVGAMRVAELKAELDSLGVQWR